MHVVDPETAVTTFLKDTAGYSVFSTCRFGNYLLAGCFSGTLYVFD